MNTEDLNKWAAVNLVKVCPCSEGFLVATRDHTFRKPTLTEALEAAFLATPLPEAPVEPEPAP